MPKQPVTVRLIDAIDDYHRVEAVQAAAWGLSDLTEVVPLTVLLTAQENGGLVAGAFDANDNMIGFVFGFIGLTRDGKFKHCSHMAGVLPNIRRQNIGYSLKLFQRDHVLKQGLLDLVTWTYDPLESVNAMLNIGKLGGIAHHYSENHYGDWNDDLNRGIPTDRFEVEWWVRSQRVANYLRPDYVRQSRAGYLESGAQFVFDAEIDALGLPHYQATHLELSAPMLLLEIPAEFQQLKRHSMAMAQQWRMKTREAFQRYFGQGYSVCDFVSEREGEYRRNYYVLMRDVPDLDEA
jgi:predicted GNAT superfamily acetyltransferase